MNWPRKADEVERPFRPPIRPENLLECPQIRLSTPAFRTSTQDFATCQNAGIAYFQQSFDAGRYPHPPPITKPQPFSVGVFSCLIAPVPAYSCGFLRCESLRTSSAARIARSRPHSTLSWPFLAPASLPGTDPKSAKAANQRLIDQGVTRGRIKRLDCSIG